MLQYMPWLLLFPIVIGILYFMFLIIKENSKKREIEDFEKTRNVMDSYQANALSTATNRRIFREKYNDLLDKINGYIKNAIDKGDYVCHVPVKKDDVRAKELIKHLEGKGYIVNYIELKSDETFNDLRIYWGNK